MATRKTIAFTITCLNAGGAERVITSLANTLVKQFQVIIITLVDGGSFYTLDPEVKVLSCNLTIDKKQNGFGAIINNKHRVKQISKLVKQEKIDLLIGFTTSVNVLTIIAAKLNGIPVIISERNNPEVDPPNKFWKLLRNLTYKYADYLIVQTSSNKAFFNEIASDAKVKIIKNPIASVLASKRVERDMSSNTKTVLTVGRLDANKSQDLLLKAFAKVTVDDTWQLQIIGHGNKKEDYKRLVDQLRITTRVSFIENVTNIYDYYNKASIFVLTSKSEGFPNALAEALYFGIPSISTDCPHGPSDLIDNDANGILIEVDNQKMLEAQLERLMKDDNLQNYLSENALNKSKQLDIEKIADTWMQYINSLINV